MAVNTTGVLADATFHNGIDSVDLVLATLLGWDILHRHCIVSINVDVGLLTR